MDDTFHCLVMGDNRAYISPLPCPPANRRTLLHPAVNQPLPHIHIYTCAREDAHETNSNKRPPPTNRQTKYASISNWILASHIYESQQQNQKNGLWNRPSRSLFHTHTHTHAHTHTHTHTHTSENVVVDWSAVGRIRYDWMKVTSSMVTKYSDCF